MSKYHDILGVPEKASKEVVKRAFRKQAMLWHPDRNNNPEAPTRFQKINEAYEFLVEGKVPDSSQVFRTQPTDSISLYEKYKNVYIPPENPVEHAQWKAVHDQIRRDIQRENYQKMVEEHEAFLKSPHFKFYYFLYWVIKVLFYLLFLSFVVVLIVPFWKGDTGFGFTLLFFMAIFFYFFYEGHLYLENNFGAMFRDRKV